MHIVICARGAPFTDHKNNGDRPRLTGRQARREARKRRRRRRRRDRSFISPSSSSSSRDSRRRIRFVGQEDTFFSVSFLVFRTIASSSSAAPYDASDRGILIRSFLSAFLAFLNDRRVEWTIFYRGYLFVARVARPTGPPVLSLVVRIWMKFGLVLKTGPTRYVVHSFSVQYCSVFLLKPSARTWFSLNDIGILFVLFQYGFVR